MIEFKHYPHGWLKVSEVMLEKGKGPKLRKLRILDTIEADFQLSMRVYLRLRLHHKFELDSRLQKFNCGSTKRHYVENAFPEKTFLFDYAKRTSQENA